MNTSVDPKPALTLLEIETDQTFELRNISLFYKSYNYSSLLPTNKIMITFHTKFAIMFNLKVAVIITCTIYHNVKNNLRFAHLVYISFAKYSDDASGFSYSALTERSF